MNSYNSMEYRHELPFGNISKWDFIDIKRIDTMIDNMRRISGLESTKNLIDAYIDYIGRPNFKSNPGAIGYFNKYDLDNKSITKINTYIESYTNILLSSIWTFTGKPFKITPRKLQSTSFVSKVEQLDETFMNVNNLDSQDIYQGDQTIDSEEMTKKLLVFYELIESYILSIFTNHKSHFSTALKSNIRSWMELGYSILTIIEDEGDFYFKSYDPLTSVYMHDDNGELMIVITIDRGHHNNVAGTKYRIYRKITSDEVDNDTYKTHTLDITKPYGMVRSCLTDHYEYEWVVNEYFKYSSSNQKEIQDQYVHLKNNEKLNYTPVFLSIYNTGMDQFKPWGKVNEICGLIMKAGQIRAHITDKAKASLDGCVFTRNSANLVKVHDSNDKGGTDGVSANVMSVEGWEPGTNLNEVIYQMPIARDFNTAFVLKQELENEIQMIIDPNFNLSSKGIARMGKVEAEARVGADADIVNEPINKYVKGVIAPIIRNIFVILYDKLYVDDKYSSFLKDLKNMNIDIFDYDITINNAKQANESAVTLAELNNTLSVLNNVMQLNTQMGGLLNIESILLKINELSPTSVITKESISEYMQYLASQQQAQSMQGQDGADQGLQDPHSAVAASALAHMSDNQRPQ